MLGFMERVSAFFLVISLCAVAGCRSEAPPAPEAQKDQPTDEPQVAKRSFGAAITESKVTPLPDLVKDPSKYADQMVRTEGKVSAVCKSAGCWMNISDDSGTAHVKMRGHSFFVPKDASGKRAVVQAKVLKSDEGGDVCGQKDGCGKGAQDAKLELEATGVELLD